ncbi:MAG: hypothetical protein WC584_02190 [Candidatus Pacearchaeota archaeon]
MASSINSILKKVILNVKPSKEEFAEMNKLINNFVDRVEKRIEELKIDTEIFVGGSFAKKTVIKKTMGHRTLKGAVCKAPCFLDDPKLKTVKLTPHSKECGFQFMDIKKDHYDSENTETQGLSDVDIFLRFDKKYQDTISELTKKILSNMENVSLIHGSRDYFKIKIRDDFFVELIPVIKVGKPEESLNVTDLSYSHVKYINKKIKSEKIKEEIMITKAFCYANHCYGAESYINGFSGYAIELLIFYYGSFLKFIKAMNKSKKMEKIIIDIEKQFKNKNQVMMNLNSSKLQSPIILIDPTHKNRNALAALNEETFERFKKSAKDFLDNPSLEAFEEKKTDLEKIKKNSDKKSFEFILLEATTDKQEGDIAGSKLLKFYNHFSEEIEKFFKIKDKGFNYNGKTSARYYFVVKSKEEIEISGPSIKDKKNVEAFEKKHRGYFTKNGKIYSKEIVDFSLKEFFKKWVEKNSKKIKEMSMQKFIEI